MTREELKKAAYVMVLNDDHALSGSDGCWFSLTTDDDVEMLDAGDIGATDLAGDRYAMQTLLEWAIDGGYFDEDHPPADP